MNHHTSAALSEKHDPVAIRLSLLNAATQGRIEVAILELAAAFEGAGRGIEFGHGQMVGLCLGALQNSGVTFDFIADEVSEARHATDVDNRKAAIAEGAKPAPILRPTYRIDNIRDWRDGEKSCDLTAANGKTVAIVYGTPEEFGRRCVAMSLAEAAPALLRSALEVYEVADHPDLDDWKAAVAEYLAFSPATSSPPASK